MIEQAQSGTSEPRVSSHHDAGAVAFAPDTGLGQSVSGAPPLAAALTLGALGGAALTSIATLLVAVPAAAPGANTLAGALGFSRVTLGLVLPVCAVALGLAKQGSVRGYVIWLGSLVYLASTSLELAARPPLVGLYPVHILAAACAAGAFARGLAAYRSAVHGASIAHEVPRRRIAAFALAVGGVTLAAWLATLAGQTHAEGVRWAQGEGAIGYLVRALELLVQGPLALATSWLVLRRVPLGFVAAGAGLAHAACMATTLLVISASAGAGPEVFEAAPFAAVALGALVLLVALLARLHRPSQADRTASPVRVSRLHAAVA